MATYTPESLNIKAPAGGFQTGGWYQGRQYWGGTLSDPGAIHQASDQQGAGQLVSQEVNAQSAQQQGTTPQAFEGYLQQQRQNQPATAQPTQAQAPAPARQTATPTSGMSEAGVSGVSAPAGLDLPELNKTLIANSPIKDLEAQYSQMEKDFIEAKGQTNDNPFLSEATRVGREAKLQKLFDERTANIRGDIATQKADIEMQLNLAMKQFDIDSQVAQQAQQQANFMLGAGMLDNASGEDIAALTRQTGISGSMWQSAINARKESLKKDVNTQVISSTADDGTVTISVINTDTGEMIKQQSLGQIGNKQTGGGSSTKIDVQEVRNSIRSDVKGGTTFGKLFDIYSGLGITPNDIFQIYNASSPYGAAKESSAELRKLGIDV